jgi:hypothetical protein
MEEVVASIDRTCTLRALLKLCENPLSSEDPKYRHINLLNAKFNCESHFACLLMN